MTTTQHSTGPWRLNAGNETEIMGGERGRFNVARAHCGGMYGIGLHEAEANARLIAAAPELLEALRQSTIALSCAARRLGGSELIATNIQLEANRAILARVDKEF